MISFLLILYSVSTIQPVCAVLTGVSCFTNQSTGKSIVLCGDYHDSPTILSPELADCAQEQVNTIVTYFPSYTIAAELPWGNTNNNVLGLLKKKGAINLENRLSALFVYNVLNASLTRQEKPSKFESVCFKLVADDYQKQLISIKEAYASTPALSMAKAAIEEVEKSQAAFAQLLDQHNIKPADSILKLYDVKEPKKACTIFRKTWNSLFDLHALHTVYQKMQEVNSLLVCVGTMHAASLYSWLQQLDGYSLGYNKPNYKRFSAEELSAALLTAEDIKMAANDGLQGSSSLHA